jgi:hypothetical protein
MDTTAERKQGQDNTSQNMKAGNGVDTLPENRVAP